MSAIGNLVWFIFGGIFMGLGWWLVGMLAFLSIVGIPWGKACFVIGYMSFFPFGNEAISRYELTLEHDIGTSGLGVVGNVIWFIVAGWWLALGHLCCAIFWLLTIIGIPFGIQHLKLAGISVAPIGKTVVSKDLAHAARRANARVAVVNLREAY
ncbi:MAG: YccF domain-containing protein [Pseudomonadales bacterium]|nr:YccF domain-containing protein [Pseudomonadales bacterium]